MKRLRSTFSIELLLLAVSLLPACASDSYGAGTFFVLSEAGRTLMAVSLNGMETFARVVEGSPETLLDTSHNRVGTLAWTAGPGGVIARRSQLRCPGADPGCCLRSGGRPTEARPKLREASIERTRVSGLAVGDEHVYVTLQGTPHVLLAERPQT